jgi:spore germination cell wall hydrolase CwlJ-like protein
MSDEIDLTPDAVDRLASHIQKSCACALGANAEQPVAGTLRALSARLTEVEAERAAITENTLRIYEKLAQAVEALRAWKDAGDDASYYDAVQKRNATLAKIGEGHE